MPTYNPTRLSSTSRCRSGPAATLDQVVAALQGSGVTQANFSGLSPAYSPWATGLSCWGFSLPGVFFESEEHRGATLRASNRHRQKQSGPVDVVFGPGNTSFPAIAAVGVLRGRRPGRRRTGARAKYGGRRRPTAGRHPRHVERLYRYGSPLRTLPDPDVPAGMLALRDVRAGGAPATWDLNHRRVPHVQPPARSGRHRRHRQRRPVACLGRYRRRTTRLGNYSSQSLERIRASQRDSVELSYFRSLSLNCPPRFPLSRSFNRLSEGQRGSRI